MDWAKKLEELSGDLANYPEGDGWFKFDEFTKNAKVGKNQAYKLLNKAIKSGQVEVHRGSEYNKAHGHRTRSVWYRFISPK